MATWACLTVCCSSDYFRRGGWRSLVLLESFSRRCARGRAGRSLGTVPGPVPPLTLLHMRTHLELLGRCGVRGREFSSLCGVGRGVGGGRGGVRCAAPAHPVGPAVAGVSTSPASRSIGVGCPSLPLACPPSLRLSAFRPQPLTPPGLVGSRCWSTVGRRETLRWCSLRASARTPRSWTRIVRRGSSGEFPVFSGPPPWRRRGGGTQCVNGPGPPPPAVPALRWYLSVPCPCPCSYPGLPTDRMKLNNDDYKGMDPAAALADFKTRVAKYEEVYEPLAEVRCPRCPPSAPWAVSPLGLSPPLPLATSCAACTGGALRAVRACLLLVGFCVRGHAARPACVHPLCVVTCAGRPVLHQAA
jgi:hypothetical protein